MWKEVPFQSKMVYQKDKGLDLGTEPARIRLQLFVCLCFLSVRLFVYLFGCLFVFRGTVTFRVK